MKDARVIDQIPNDRVGDPETPSGFGDADAAIAGDETIPDDGIECGLAFFL